MPSRSSNQPGSFSTGAAFEAAPVPISGRDRWLRRLEPWLYLAPGLLMFTLFVLVPVIGTLVLSTTTWNGISWDTAKFVGLGNYGEIFKDPRFRNAFLNNVSLIPFFVILPTLIGLIPAGFIPRMKLRGSRWIETGLFLPYVMPGVLIGVVWAWILNPRIGPVNRVLRDLGFKPPTWLGDFTWALPTVGMIGAWAAYGFCFVVFLAGVQKISNDLYEAARLDGASAWQEFVDITLPGLRREIALVVSLCLINALRAFDVVKATTDGGPGEQTQVMALYMIKSAFKTNEAGYGTAMAVVLALITFISSALVLRVLGERDA